MFIWSCSKIIFRLAQALICKASELKDGVLSKLEKMKLQIRFVLCVFNLFFYSLISGIVQKHLSACLQSEKSHSTSKRSDTAWLYKYSFINYHFICLHYIFHQSCRESNNLPQKYKHVFDKYCIISAELHLCKYTNYSHRKFRSI